MNSPESFMHKTSRTFIKVNALMSAQKILAIDKEITLTEPILTLAWEVLYDLKGFARPVKGWMK